MLLLAAPRQQPLPHSHALPKGPSKLSLLRYSLLLPIGVEASLFCMRGGLIHAAAHIAGQQSPSHVGTKPGGCDDGHEEVAV